jgi:hypothetical protein
MGVFQELRFKIQDIAADRFTGVQYPRMNLRQSRHSFLDRWLHYTTRLGIGVLGIYLALLSLAIITAGLFALYVLIAA